MKTELVSLYEIEYIPELWDWLDLKDDDYFADDPLSFFEGDPDMIKHEGYTEYFMFLEIKDTLYIISNTDEPAVWDILQRFADDADSFDYPEPNDWDSFHNTDNAIAFRNGRGYVYNIYHFDAE